MDPLVEPIRAVRFSARFRSLAVRYRGFELLSRSLPSFSPVVPLKSKTPSINSAPCVAPRPGNLSRGLESRTASRCVRVVGVRLN